jgi:HSP90 family molecular chaperone
MRREELLESLGTIVYCGPKAFLQQIREIAGNPSLIGQFGVGFYSAFWWRAGDGLYTVV